MSDTNIPKAKLHIIIETWDGDDGAWRYEVTDKNTGSLIAVGYAEYYVTCAGRCLEIVNIQNKKALELDEEVMEY